jgi:hypothetical protein
MLPRMVNNWITDPNATHRSPYSARLRICRWNRSAPTVDATLPSSQQTASTSPCHPAEYPGQRQERRRGIGREQMHSPPSLRNFTHARRYGPLHRHAGQFTPGRCHEARNTGLLVDCSAHRSESTRGTPFPLEWPDKRS